MLGCQTQQIKEVQYTQITMFTMHYRVIQGNMIDPQRHVIITYVFFCTMYKLVTKQGVCLQDFKEITPCKRI